MIPVRHGRTVHGADIDAVVDGAALGFPDPGPVVPRFEAGGRAQR